MSRMNWKFGAVLGSIVIAMGSFITATSRAQVQTTFEPNTDRLGSDYFDFQLPAPQPSLCQQACLGDNNCRAWTYVQPGFQGPQARCYLKNPAPPPTPSNCCVSGAKTVQIPTQSCDQLWVARNSIYKMHRYCFRTQRAIDYFGNEGCIFQNEDDVPLTSAERAQIAQYRAQERAMGCP